MNSKQMTEKPCLSATACRARKEDIAKVDFLIQKLRELPTDSVRLFPNELVEGIEMEDDEEEE